MAKRYLIVEDVAECPCRDDGPGGSGACLLAEDVDFCLRHQDNNLPENCPLLPFPFGSHEEMGEFIKKANELAKNVTELADPFVPHGIPPMIPTEAIRGRR